MWLKNLFVVHQSSTGANFLAESAPFFEAFFVETCLRRLWVTTGASVPVPKGAQVYEGQEAYRLLLEITTGLASAIPGETDVFGQFKSAWQKNAHLYPELQNWIQRLFEDTKEIRSKYLQNIGGSSYGSLARMLIQPEEQHEVLLIGAGQLGQSVAAYFENLMVWNRTSEKARGIGAEVVTDLTNALSLATHVVVCVPYEESRDREYFLRWREGKSADSKFLHLGCHTSSAPEGMLTLKDIFQLQKEKGDFRSIELARAREACRERAILRNMGGSLSLAHGWEDLAVFDLA